MSTSLTNDHSSRYIYIRREQVVPHPVSFVVSVLFIYVYRYSPCTENFYISILSYPTSYIQHPTSYIQHPTSYIQHPTSSILHPTSSILHPTSSILHPTSSILHPASYIKILSNPILSYPIQSYPAKIFKIISIETKKLRLLGFKGVHFVIYEVKRNYEWNILLMNKYTRMSECKRLM